jgi:cytosine/uracil/thiamine/allantoin permease
MKDFLKFLLIWISQNLAIPFWMIGHIHLSMNMSIYQDLHIILASLGMNLIVAIGFWVDFKSQKDK